MKGLFEKTGDDRDDRFVKIAFTLEHKCNAGIETDGFQLKNCSK